MTDADLRPPPAGLAGPVKVARGADIRAVAIFQERPSLGKAQDLRSPPNGAAPGPTSRDEE